MSLSIIKAKEAKGRQKCLPKLKTILANPYKTKCPELNADEVSQLEQILCTVIGSSGEKPQAFATTKRIRLGLENSLRAINNRQCSCVLVSLSIKPRCLVSLIARNVEVKDETVPVYAQPQLEQFTERVFGVQALTLVLPTIAEMKRLELSEDLIAWVETRKKPARVKVMKTVNPIKKIKKQRIATTASINVRVDAIKNEIVKPVEQADNTSDSNSEYISFAGANHSDFVIDTEADALQLEATLSKTLQNASKVTEAEFEAVNALKTLAPVKIDVANAAHDDGDVDNDEAYSDGDDILPPIEYQPLTVHKIRANPLKKPKKKRNKNKQKKN